MERRVTQNGLAFIAADFAWNIQPFKMDAELPATSGDSTHLAQISLPFNISEGGRRGEAAELGVGRRTREGRVGGEGGRERERYAARWMRYFKESRLNRWSNHGGGGCGCSVWFWSGSLSSTESVTSRSTITIDDAILGGTGI